MKAAPLKFSWLKSLFAASILCFALPLSAADLLAEVRARLVPAPVTQGEFSQTRHLVQIKKPLVSTGRFLVVRDAGVIWENIAPIAQTMRLTKNEILQTNDGGAVVRLSADKEPVVGIINSILFGVLAGEFETLAQSFSYDGKMENGRWRLDFTPRDANLARLIETLSLTGTHDIEQVEIRNAAGDVTRIEFRAQTHAGEVSAEVRKRFE
ncbi:MAG: outer membrane lipoprotein carrier protein LolA [Azoarcus sp.]|jgi:hypothetical protein|nr:outer membrane lipoprotein carrier protein LolA [Azoarcus sp.]